MHRDVLSLRLLVTQSPLQKYSEISLILVIADFRRGLCFVLFTELMLRKCLDIWPYQLKTQLSAAEDMDAWDHKASRCLFALLSLCGRKGESPRSTMHAWAPPFLCAPTFCPKAWGAPHSLGLWVPGKTASLAGAEQSLKRAEASFYKPVALN